jgi:hypothetical protein
VSTPEPFDAPVTAPWAPPTVVPPPGATVPIRSSRALATATLTLYWCRTGAAALQALVFLNRRTIINRMIKHSAAGGITRSELDADDRARAFILIVAVLLVGFTLAAAIVTSLWARRVTENARARGDRIVRPGLATGGWYIPIGWFWVGFNQIKEAVSRAGHSPSAIKRWQTVFILATVVYVLALQPYGNTDTLVGLRTALTVALAAIVLTVGLLVWCTIAATKALRSTTDALG